MTEPKGKRTRARLKSDASRQAVKVSQPKFALPNKYFSLEMSAAEFFAMLDVKASEKYGPCENGYEREITWQSNPDRGMIEIMVVDKPRNLETVN